MADENTPVRKHIAAAHQHLETVARTRREHRRSIAEHVRQLREQHPHLPKPPPDQEAQ